MMRLGGVRNCHDVNFSVGVGGRGGGGIWSFGWLVSMLNYVINRPHVGGAVLQTML